METKKTPLIFVVDDSVPCSSFCHYTLSQIGYTNVQCFDNGEDCMAQLHLEPKVIFLDFDLGDSNGLDFLKQIKKANPHQMVVMLSGQEDIRIAVNALKFGAFDYITKEEFTQEKVRVLIQKIAWIRKEVADKQRKNFFTRTALQLGSFSLLAILKKEI